MFKRRLLIFACLLLCVPTFADDNTNGIYVGTPKGFYDDIDPNSLDEELFIAGDKLYKWGDTLYLDE